MIIYKCPLEVDNELAIFTFLEVRFVDKKFFRNNNRLLVCLTEKCESNVLYVLHMKHWHTFAVQTIDQYPGLFLIYLFVNRFIK